jgi:teichuronic acid biosynthesis glycosyltransferase TuaC
MSLTPEQGPSALVVLSTTFPSMGQPNLGLFVRERMFRVARKIPLVVVAPVPWFPFQRVIQRFYPHFRPETPFHEVQDGVDVYHPRFLCAPLIFKSTDALFLALGSLPILLRIRKKLNFQVIDAHFAYPDGVAAYFLSRWLALPFTITLRGTLGLNYGGAIRRWLAAFALKRAARVFSVSCSLKKRAIEIGLKPDHVKVIANGVGLEKFSVEDKAICRKRLNIDSGNPILVSVGGLTERKGYHHVIEVLPRLLREFPKLKYVIAGGPSPEGDWSDKLARQVASAGLHDVVKFLGPVRQEQLKYVYSAGDVFVLATRMEGWANVFLEAMACGLPVVTTRVGGNQEVVSSPTVGILVPFGDLDSLQLAIADALGRNWDRQNIVHYASQNGWEKRIPLLLDEFNALFRQRLNHGRQDVTSKRPVS